MKPLRTALLAAGLAVLVAAPPLSAQETFSGADLYEKCVKSCVFIVTPGKDGGASSGSGSLIDAEKRYVITNYHVVDDAPWVFVQFPVRNKDGSLMTDKRKYMERIPAGQALKGKVLHRDKTRDLALVQLDRLPPDTRAIPLAKKSVRVGEQVINIGNPGKVRSSTFSTTQGTVRAVDVVDMVVRGADEVLRIKCRMVVTTNPVNPGDSGGPLIDKRGYQVAVTESGIFDGRTQNVNSFVDCTEVRAFLDEKKITIKDLTDEPDEPKPQPKGGQSLDPGPRKKSDPPAVPGPDKKVDPPAAPPASPADEKAASAMLQRARLFKDSDQSYFAQKLKDIVAKYPNTEAGKEAKKLLDGLK